MIDPFYKQVANRNFLATTGFKFTLARAPKADFFSNQVNIPGFSLGVAIQPTYLKNIPVPGDKLEFNDFTMRFMIDEDLVNYNVISNWMRGLGYPENVKEYSDWIYDDHRGNIKNDPNISDGSLIVYNSNFQPTLTCKFKGMFPTSLSDIEFDASATDEAYATASVTFKYVIYDLLEYES